MTKLNIFLTILATSMASLFVPNSHAATDWATCLINRIVVSNAGSDNVSIRVTGCDTDPSGNPAGYMILRNDIADQMLAAVLAAGSVGAAVDIGFDSTTPGYVTELVYGSYSSVNASADTVTMDIDASSGVGYEGSAFMYPALSLPERFNYPALDTISVDALQDGYALFFAEAGDEGASAAWTNCESSGGLYPGAGFVSMCILPPALSAQSVTVFFDIRTYTITAGTDGNGTISPAGSTAVPHNSSQQFDILANQNYHILDVEVDGSSVGVVDTYTFSNVISNHTIHATFDHDPLTITASSGPNGSIEPSGEVVVDYNSSQTFTFSPSSSDYIIKDVTVDGISQGQISAYTFSDVTTSHTISVSFIDSVFSLDVARTGSGTGIVYSDPSGIYCGVDCSQNYATNTQVTLSAIPDSESSFIGWEGDGCSGTNTSCTVTMDQARNISAEFTSNTKELTITKISSGGGNGSVSTTPAGLFCDLSCTSESILVDFGSQVMFEATSSPGSKFGGWTSATCMEGTNDGVYCTVEVSENISITATFIDDPDYIPLENKAIIVAGTGESSTNYLWPDTVLNTNYAFKALLAQGFTEDKIEYLNSDQTIDVNGDGIIDVDGDATLANLETAVTSWASDADQVVIYMTGHGDVGNFIIKRSDLPSEELLDLNIFSDWLDTLQQTVSGRVIVIYDACSSGSLINPAGRNQNRIVLTSAKSDEKASFAADGRISFSYQFWSVVFEGGLLVDAFNNGDSSWSTQNAQYDINNDGLSNKGDDIFPPIRIGVGVKFASGTLPLITGYSPRQASKENSAVLWVEASSPAEITDVWAVIVPPSYIPNGPGTAGDSFPIVSLTDDNSDGRYETLYNDFSERGTYQISFYAMNKYKEVSLPATTYVSSKGSSSFPWIYLVPIMMKNSTNNMDAID